MKTDIHDVMDALPRKRGSAGVPLGSRVSVSELPDGRQVGDLSRDELAKALGKLKIEGVSATNTAEANVALYERHLQRIFDDGGNDAIFNYLMSDEHDNRQDEDKENDE